MWIYCTSYYLCDISHETACVIPLLMKLFHYCGIPVYADIMHVVACVSPVPAPMLCSIFHNRACVLWQVMSRFLFHCGVCGYNAQVITCVVSSIIGLV